MKERITKVGRRKQYEIGQQLKFAREYRGYTQTKLAKVCDVSQSNLSNFEKGLNTLSDESIERIMKELNFPLSFLDEYIKPLKTSLDF